MLRLPLFGDLTRKSSISRFSRTLGTLVTSGVPILQALNITRETAGNHVVGEAIGKVHDSVKEGESIVQPLEASGIFPPMVISMIDVGEETGQLPEMLLKVAEVYDDEVDNAVAGLTSLLEPIMIVFLAVVVGTIVIALFLPLITIISARCRAAAASSVAWKVARAASPPRRSDGIIPHERFSSAGPAVAPRHGGVHADRTAGGHGDHPGPGRADPQHCGQRELQSAKSRAQRRSRRCPPRMESYKADNGAYPPIPASTETADTLATLQTYSDPNSDP